MKIKDMSTSVGFGFYIHDYEDYLDFKINLDRARKLDSEFLIGFEDTTPNELEFNDNDVIEC